MCFRNYDQTESSIYTTNVVKLDLIKVKNYYDHHLICTFCCKACFQHPLLFHFFSYFTLDSGHTLGVLRPDCSTKKKRRNEKKVTKHSYFINLPHNEILSDLLVGF